MSERLQETETPKETPETEFSEKPLTRTGRAAMQGFSENAPLNKNDASDWVDHGVIDVPVADLPEPEGVESPADFDHHISWEDAQTATKQLPEIQKGLGEGKTGDDFSAEDQAAGKDYANGKRRVYDLFYGSDPVRLNKDGNTYDIVGGRHRIFAAKELGLETIPARVIEKNKAVDDGKKTIHPKPGSPERGKDTEPSPEFHPVSIKQDDFQKEGDGIQSIEDEQGAARKGLEPPKDYKPGIDKGG